MKLEDQVCSIELAKKLNELGIKQDSLFYWDWHSDECYAVKFTPYSCPGLERYSAFTVSELGELLPDWQETVKRADKDWVCIIRHKHNDINDHSFAETEADARAQMLIYLIENKLIGGEK